MFWVAWRWKVAARIQSNLQKQKEGPCKPFLLLNDKGMYKPVVVQDLPAFPKKFFDEVAAVLFSKEDSEAGLRRDLGFKC